MARSRNEIRDTDYGNYSSFEDSYYWADDFCPRKEAREKACRKFETAKIELLDEIAYENGLDTTDWDRNDYQTFMEIMDIS